MLGSYVKEIQSSVDRLHTVQTDQKAQSIKESLLDKA